MSKKLQNQIKKTEKNMKQLLMKYNSSRDQLKEETKRSFLELNLDLIKQQETFNLEDVDTEVTAIPVCFCPERDYGNVCPACPVVS